MNGGAREGERIRVLHAEDDAPFRDLVGDLLAGAGIEVVPAATPREALDSLDAERFDCVLSDYDADESGAFRPVIEATEGGPPCVLVTGKDRDRIDAAVSAAVDDYVRKGAGNLPGTLAERVRNHAARYRSAERYRALFEEGAEPMVIHDADSGSVIDANPQYASLMGYEPDAVGSLGMDDISPDGETYSTERAMERLSAAAAGESQTFEWENVTADGERLPVEVTLKRMAVAGAGRVLATVRDIGDRKRREAALQRHKRQTERLHDAATSLLGAEEPERVHEGVLDAAESVLDPPFCALVIREGDRLVPVAVGGSEPNAPSEPLPLNESPEWAAIHTGETREYVTASGRTLCVPIDDYGVLCLRDDEPDDAHTRELAETLCSHAAAVLERVHREERLRERSRRRESIAAAFPDYVFFFDADYVYREVWLASDHEDRGGASEEAMLGDRVGDRVDGRAASTVRDAIDEAIATGEVREIEYAVEEQSRTARLEARVAPLPDDGRGGPEVVVVARDVTTQRQYERRLEAQNERLDEFASMVSHDLRNPLNVVQGRLELAETLAEDEVAEHVRAAESATHRMSDLIDDMLTMARTDEREMAVGPVSIDSAANRAWAAIAAPVSTLSLATEGARVRADEDGLIRLFENLFRNSVEHGTSSRTASEGTAEHGPSDSTDTHVRVRVETLPDGFAVADDGRGVPAEHREQVFESGYSTATDGTGYGLEIVERVADAHGWSVSLVESEAGGARFEVTGVSFADGEECGGRDGAA